MRIPLGRDHTAEVFGAAIRHVVCEKCSETYHYFIDRVGSGSGYSVLFLDGAGAESRAQTKADNDLEQKLQTEVDPVPCPVCGWYQSNMIPVAQSRKYEGMALWAVLFTVGFAIQIIGVIAGRDIQPKSRTILAIGSAICGVLGAGFALGQKWLQKRYDPNETGISERLALASERAIGSVELSQSGTARIEEQIEQKHFLYVLSEYRWALSYRVIGSITAFVMGCSFVAMSYEETFHGIRSLNWPTAEAQIETAEIQLVPAANKPNATMRYSLNLKYRYTVAGAQYSGSRYWFSPGPSGPLDEIETVRDQLHDSQPLMTRYLPSNPEVCVLVPGIPASRLIYPAIALIVFSGGLTFLAINTRRFVRSRADVEKARQESRR